jgi:hypothetical protein
MMGDGQPSHEYHAPGKEIAYAGEPSTRWEPLNQEAVDAMRALIEKRIANSEETRKFIPGDPAGLRSLAALNGRIGAMKSRLAGLRISSRAGPQPEPAAFTRPEEPEPQPQSQGRQQGRRQ